MSDVPDLGVGENDYTVPAIEILSGRGFVTGKSGSGKSNTASVVAEELLDAGLPLLVIDTDGEYYGLKESYELLHVGGDDRCDARVGPDHADRLARLALEEHVPIVLDVSGYAEADEARETVASVVGALFDREREARTPFLLVAEEVHEYVPQRGNPGEAGEALLRVAKRGRKRGLGLLGVSQRPAAVDKEFVTQCDWLVFHRLTWENDTRVVGSILGDGAAEEVTGLEAGEALVRTDWTESVERVRFRRKRTFDAGATPSLDGVERPDLRSVDSDLVAELRGPGEGDRSRPDRSDPGASDTGEGSEDDGSHEVAGLRAELKRKRERIVELEARVAELEGRTADDPGDERGAERAPATDGGRTRTAVGDGRGDAVPDGDPAWEAGALVAYLLGSAWRRTVRGVRRLAGTPAGRPDPDAADGGTDPGEGIRDEPGSKSVSAE
jgi:hypothetical protein